MYCWREGKKRGSILGLANMHALMKELNNVQNIIPTIHIAGTNGKGSVGAYLASICKEAGLTVGRYCSPAVFDPLECWQYDGRNITKEEYAECMSQVKNACDILACRATSFEIETAMAFVYFSKKKPDVLLLETGMGGKTDATNVVDNPIACVFTTISKDHMQFLGETLEEIASVKAGIMKPGAYIIWGQQGPEVLKFLQSQFEKVRKKDNHLGVTTVCQTACAEDIKLISEKPGEMKFAYQDTEYVTGMAGVYQLKNAALAITVFKSIWPRLCCNIKSNLLQTEMDLKQVLQSGIFHTRWPGRFEVIGESPLFIIDGAHNEDASVQLAKTVENCFTNQVLTFIIGVLADKEHKKMLSHMLPYAKRVFTVTPSNARGMDGMRLAEEVRDVCNSIIEVTYCASLEDAIDNALAYATKSHTPILAFGSLSYLGELKEVYIKRCK